MDATLIATSDLQSQLVVVATAFVLTTIVGGLIANFYERRRAATQLRETQRETAKAVYEELSRLMDRRLYRMRQVVWTMDRPEPLQDQFRAKWSDYREVLYEWNDSLNRNLALALHYFGPHVMQTFECEVAEMFAGANDELREHYRRLLDEASGNSATLTIGELDAYLAAIDDALYRLNSEMLAVIARADYRTSGGDRPACSDGPVGGQRLTLLLEFKHRLRASG